MQIRIPQFIEHDPKLLGPFTLSQTIYVAAALFGTFMLYLFIGEDHFFIFIFIAGILFSVAIFLAFYKVEGLSVSAAIKNSVDYNMKTKLYLWKRKQIPIYLSTNKKEDKKEDKSKRSPLTVKKKDGKMDTLIKKIDFEK